MAALTSARSMLLRSRSLPLALQTLRQQRAFASQDSDVANDNAAIETFRKLENAFCNIPLDSIRFEVGKHFVSSQPHPQIFVGNNKISGILHVAPFAKTTFTWFGEKGNLGRKLNFNGNETTITDPRNAEQEVSITIEALNSSMAHNELARDYFVWLQAIQGKFLKHLLENYDKYPSMKKKLDALKGKNFTNEVIAEMLEADATNIVKRLKNDKGVAIPDSDFIQFKQRIFYRGEPDQLVKAVLRTQMDKDMHAKGLVRRHIPLYDSVGKEVPLEEASLRKGDVISVVNYITPNLYQIGSRVGYGLRRTMKSIVMLRQGRTSGDAFGAVSPFGSAALPGGVVFQ